MRRAKNYTAEHFASSQPADKKRKRLQDRSACQICRNRKVACDRRHPCQNCVALKCPGDCRYDREDNVRSSSAEGIDTPHSGETLAIRKASPIDARVASLETAIERLTQKVNSAIQSGGANSSDQTIDDSVDQAQTNHPIPSSSSSNPFADFRIDCKRHKDDMFHISHHHYSQPFSTKMRYIFVSTHLFATRFARLSDLAFQFDPKTRRTMWDFAIIPNPTMDPESSLMAEIPDQSVCDTMVARFLLTVNCTHPVVDPDMLLESIRDFWAANRPKPTIWLALYLAIIALGYQLPVTIPPDERYDQKGRQKGKALMEKVSVHALRLAQSSKRPTIHIIQVVLLLVIEEKLSLDWIDGFDISNGLLGMASRLASTGGLHRGQDRSSHLPEAQLRLRYKIFWTYTFLEAEHALQCGNPWHHRTTDHDVPFPSNAEAHWSEYLKRVAEHMPICSQVISISHSHRANVRELKPQELDYELGILKLLDVAPPLSSGRSGEIDMTAVIQHALVGCLNARLRVSLTWMGASSHQVAGVVRQDLSVVEHCVTILDYADYVAKAIQTVPEKTRDAWTHYAIALLRCFIYFAGSTTLGILRGLDRGPHLASDETVTVLFAKIRSALQFLGGCLPFSRETIKRQVFHWAEFHSVEEQIQSPGKVDPNVDLDTAGGSLVALVTQQSMDRTIQKALIALDEARKSDNPPPGLLATPREPIPSKEASSAQPAESAVDSDLFADWFLDLDDWANNSGVLDDATAPWM